MEQQTEETPVEKVFKIINDIDGSYDLIRRAAGSAGVRNKHDIEDLLQDTLISIFLKLDTYDPSKPIRTWVYTIAVNKSRSHLRSKALRPKLSIDNPINSQTDNFFLGLLEHPKEDPREIYAAEENRETVNNAVQKLPYNLRKLVLLHYFEGVEYEDIAEQLGRPVGSVRSGLYSARKDLAKLLQAG